MLGSTLLRRNTINTIFYLAGDGCRSGFLPGLVLLGILGRCGALVWVVVVVVVVVRSSLAAPHYVLGKFRWEGGLPQLP